MLAFDYFIICIEKIVHLTQIECQPTHIYYLHLLGGHDQACDYGTEPLHQGTLWLLLCRVSLYLLCVYLCVVGEKDRNGAHGQDETKSRASKYNAHGAQASRSCFPTSIFILAPRYNMLLHTHHTYIHTQILQPSMCSGCGGLPPWHHLGRPHYPCGIGLGLPSFKTLWSWGEWRTGSRRETHRLRRRTWGLRASSYVPVCP